MLETEKLGLKETPVLVLAGGAGTRLVEITKNKVAKSLVELSNGETFLDQLLNGLENVGFGQFIFCLGLYSDQIISHLKERIINSVNYSFSIETIPLGTAGAIELALRNFSVEVPFLVVTSDAIFPYQEISLMKRVHKNNSITWALNRNAISTMNNYSGIMIEPAEKVIVQDKRAVCFTEDRLQELLDFHFQIEEMIDAGHAIVDPKLFAKLISIYRHLYPNQNKICLYKDLLPLIAEISRRKLIRNLSPLIFAYIETNPTIDMGTPDRYHYVLTSGKDVA